jgi:hypothetical protein
MDVLGRAAIFALGETSRRQSIAGHDMISVAGRTIYVRTERAQAPACPRARIEVTVLLRLPMMLQKSQ